MKNGQISLYFHFNKIIKGSGTNFQSPSLNKKHIRNVIFRVTIFLKSSFSSLKIIVALFCEYLKLV